MRCIPVLLFVFLAISTFSGYAAETIVKAGLGSYVTELPPNAKEPPAEIYQTENVRGPMPTSDWWSSLAWQKFSDCQFPHPLAVKFSSAGLRIFYPKNITVGAKGIFGGMPGAGDDFVLGHDGQAEFPDARVDGFSDWFVTARMRQGANALTVTYGHGSPFVFALYAGGNPRLTFTTKPRIWSGSAQSAALAITIREKHYGLFGPSGSTWSGLDGETWTNKLGGRDYFSIALLPDNSPETLALFAAHAHAHVIDTKVVWRYEPEQSTVTTSFNYQTVPREGKETNTIFALYPHQWMNTQTALMRQSYNSVRGEMKLGKGSSFTTRHTFPGVLPALPDFGGCEAGKLKGYIDSELRSLQNARIGDTYWEGKRLGKIASLVPIAEQAGHTEGVDAFSSELAARLEMWFSATNGAGALKSKGVFYYNQNWGTLIGYPASYGSDRELSDHHFHYGYFIRAAAEVARRNRAWGEDARWGALLKMLIRDAANPERGDTLFPFLRNFDPYAGHSWASGAGNFADGNNNESSSEAMNAWAGLILWGEAMGDSKVRELGIYLFTTEMAAINAYWFDVTSELRPPQYKPSVVTMVWGGKGVNETWFSSAPEMIHGINWLPVHGGSLYLGLYPDYVKRNFEALRSEKAGAPLRAWVDIIWMYQALHDADAAFSQFEAASDLRSEAGNSLANTYHWIGNLRKLGQVDRTVTADYPVYAVFKRGQDKTHVAYNYGESAREVRFSDGVKVTVKPKSFGLAQTGGK